MTANRDRIPTTHETEWFLAARVSQDVLADEAREAREDRLADAEATALAERLGLTAKDARINHATSGPTEYGIYVDRNGRNNYALRTDVVAPAPAPATVVHTGKRPSVRPYTVPRGWVDPKDLLDRCTAAARLTLTGKAWSREDVLECASDLVVDVLKNHPCTLGYVAPSACVMHALCCDARNWATSRMAQVNRDTVDTVKRVSMARTDYTLPGSEDDSLVAAPMRAAKLAIDAIQNLGLDRRVWALAYTSARVADGADGRTVAAELGMTETAYRQAVSRARKYVPSAVPAGKDDPTTYATYCQHLETVCASPEAFPRDPRSVAESVGTDPDWTLRSERAYRTGQHSDRETVTRTDTRTVSVTRDRAIRTDGRKDNRPDWARDLDASAPRRARRLKTGAELRRARENGRTAEDRAHRRQRTLAVA
jgi:hypothetical protein